MTTVTIPPRTAHGWVAALADSRLPADVKAVGVALADWANDELVSSPGIAALQAATGLLEWKTIRAVHDLTLTGWIEKSASRPPFKASHHDQYRLLGGKL